MTSIDLQETNRLLAQHYGMDGELTELPSEWGGTYRVRTKSQTYLLKIAPPAVEEERTNLEVAALKHLGALERDYAVPTIVADLQGRDLVSTDRGLMRLYHWVDGRLWHTVNPIGDQLMLDLGSKLGAISRDLQSFTSQRSDGSFAWAPWNLLLQDDNVPLFTGEHADILHRVFEDFKSTYLPVAELLPQQMTYNDGNDHNLIVSQNLKDLEFIGFIDFGDMEYGPAVGDLAVCLAYVMMGSKDPVHRACQVITGFQSVRALSEDELRVLYPLIRARLALTVIHARKRQERDASNAYWQISAEPAWQLLSQLDQYNSHLALCRMRHAAGYEPSPTSAQLRAFLRENRDDIYPVLGFDLAMEKVAVFDWSVSSLNMGGFDAIADVAASTNACFAEMTRQEVRVGVGRYNEPRAVYTTDEYAIPSDIGPQMRTVHIGIDLFMPAGTPLYAPFDGEVFTVVNDSGDKEYGPLVILKHELPDAPTFYTLYGHNDLATLQLWNRGDSVKQGDLIAYMGDYPVNGNWVPHSHFQIITDMLDYKDDFPGVVLPSQREVWLSMCPDPNLILGVQHPGMLVQQPAPEELLVKRSTTIPNNLSVAQMHIVRGWKTRLYAADGTSYLDTRNNIAHVGHEHPLVVKAGQEQMAVLNTNSRYLHAARTELAERLLATLPDNLSRIVFVNSGSEANDLALRIARNKTQVDDTLIMWQGYHGHTQSCIDVSHYKFAGKGGGGKKAHVHLLPEIENDSTDYRTYLSMVPAVPLTFIHESLPGCAGQIVPPVDYFSRIYSVVHGHGGVCIADEVQTGLGRVGSHYWSFERFDIEPDIVTIGKPLGNGHPVAAVAMSEDLANSFDNGMEFFSSFGGNPVSCRVALAVMDVIEQEELMARAMVLGEQWKSLLTNLKDNTLAISDVRGYGLFIGIEFASTAEKRPGEVAQYIQSRLLDYRILTSLDGPHENVLKLKPPMSVNEQEIQYFMNCLTSVVNEDFITK